jgi:hypothetical protein
MKCREYSLKALAYFARMSLTKKKVFFNSDSRCPNKFVSKLTFFTKMLKKTKKKSFLKLKHFLEINYKKFSSIE